MSGDKQQTNKLLASPLFPNLTESSNSVFRICAIAGIVMTSHKWDVPRRFRFLLCDLRMGVLKSRLS